MNKENCALKLVDEIILYYDARSKKTSNYFCLNFRIADAMKSCVNFYKSTFKLPLKFFHLITRIFRTNILASIFAQNLE